MALSPKKSRIETALVGLNLAIIILIRLLFAVYYLSLV